MTATAEEAELSEDQLLYVTGAAKIIAADVQRREGHAEMIRAELTAKRSAALEADDATDMALQDALARVQPAQDRVDIAERKRAQTEKLAGEIAEQAKSASLTVRVPAKAALPVIAAELAEATAARDAQQASLTEANNAVHRARRAQEETGAAIDAIDRALANPLGSALGRQTGAWLTYFRDQEWLSHLDPGQAGTHEGKLARSLLDSVLRMSGRGAEIEANMDTHLRAELDDGAPAKVLPDGTIVQRHPGMVRTADQARGALLPIAQNDLPPGEVRRPDGWVQTEGLATSPYGAMNQ